MNNPKKIPIGNKYEIKEWKIKKKINGINRLTPDVSIAATGFPIFKKEITADTISWIIDSITTIKVYDFFFSSNGTVRFTIILFSSKILNWLISLKSKNIETEESVFIANLLSDIEIFKLSINSK